MARRKVRIVLGVLLAGVLLGGLAFWITSSRRPGPAAPAVSGPTPAAPAPPPPQAVTMKQPVITQYEGGRLAWQVRLKELKVATGAQAVSAAGMREALIYDAAGQPAMRLTAQQAQGNTADRNLEVSGQVRAATPKGALITTEKVRWIEKERRLFCPGPVIVRTRNAALTTRGLSYLVDESLVKAPNLVRIYSGSSKLMGRQLQYDVQTEAFQMKKVQAIFNPSAARRAAGRPQG